MKTRSCPLNPDWTKTLGWIVVHYRLEFSGPPEKELLRTAHLTKRGSLLKKLSPRWKIASDDYSTRPPPEGSSYFRGYPCHIHTQFSFERQHIHIDRIWGFTSGPGSPKAEVHIFVDGKFVGFGGSWAAHGCSVSAGPGVALLANRKILVVNHSQQWRIVDKPEKILANPDPVQIYALAEDA